MKRLNILDQTENRCETCYYFVHKTMCFRYPNPVETSAEYICGEYREQKVEVREVVLNDSPLLGF